MAEHADNRFPNGDVRDSQQPSLHAQPQKPWKGPRSTTHARLKNSSPKPKDRRGAEAPGRDGCKPAAVSKAARPRGPPQPNGCSRLQNGPSAPNNAPKLQVCCPECGSAKVWKNGLRYLTDGRAVQRWLCRSCGYRFSETQVKLNVFSQFLESLNSKPNLGDKHVVRWNFPIKEIADPLPLKRGEDVASQSASLKTGIGKGLYVLSDYDRKCRVRDGEDPSKNSASQAGRGLESVGAAEKRAAGATRLPSNLSEELVNFAWHLKKQGYKDATILAKVKLLRTLVKRGARLEDPESVKEVIAKQDWSDGRKRNAVDAYSSYLAWKGLSWEKPKYKKIAKLPFIPLEEELDQLIAGCSKRMATFLQLLKETGARSGEALRLKWSDIDTVQRVVRIKPEKGSDPRIIHISPKLAAMLEELPRNYGEYVFLSPDMPQSHFRNLFCKQRKRIAHKLKNPRLLRISFHTFRHWKATMEYHKTKDILHVMRLLGHRNIKNTLTYIQIERELFKHEKQYISRVAHNIEEACSLIEAGFEYVCDYNGLKLFRKPKY